MRAVLVTIMCMYMGTKVSALPNQGQPVGGFVEAWPSDPRQYRGPSDVPLPQHPKPPNIAMSQYLKQTNRAVPQYPKQQKIAAYYQSCYQGQHCPYGQICCTFGEHGTCRYPENCPRKDNACGPPCGKGCPGGTSCQVNKIECYMTCMTNGR